MAERTAGPVRGVPHGGQRGRPARPRRGARRVHTLGVGGRDPKRPRAPHHGPRGPVRRTTRVFPPSSHPHVHLQAGQRQPRACLLHVWVGGGQEMLLLSLAGRDPGLVAAEPRGERSVQRNHHAAHPPVQRHAGGGRSPDPLPPTAGLGGSQTGDRRVAASARLSPVPRRAEPSPRRPRVTASNFGAVTRTNTFVSPSDLLRQILWPINLQSCAMRYGSAQGRATARAPLWACQREGGPSGVGLFYSKGSTPHASTSLWRCTWPTRICPSTSTSRASG